ncbi:MAG: MerR family transcriptional regulator, partial [Comamonadaceae bacterium]
MFRRCRRLPAGRPRRRAGCARRPAACRARGSAARRPAAAGAAGVDVETIRYYEKAGLLPPPAREANGYRHYAQPHLQRLAFVRHCRALDMPLADVRSL